MKRASVVLSVLAALLVPAAAFAADSCPTAVPSGADLASAPGLEAPWLTEIPAVDQQPLELVSPPCDKTWCSERRWECKQDCLPCSFSFTCYVLQCSYSCQCLC